MRATIALLIGILAVGCGPDESDAGRITTPTLVERLERGVELHANRGGTARVSGRYVAGEIEKGGTADIAILGAEGRVQLDPDGLLWLEALEIGLADVVVTPNEVPIHLTGMTVTLVEPVAALPRWTGFDLGTIELHGEATVVLEWALVGEGGVIAPLGPVRFGPLELMVALERPEPGALVVGDVRIVGRGELWSWADMLFIEDAFVEFAVTDHAPGGPLE